MEEKSYSFFVAYQTFRASTSADVGDWWSGMAEAQLSKASEMQLERGIYLHTFMPTSEVGPVLGLWECREATTCAALKEFVEGPARPPGDVLDTRVHAVDVELPGLLPETAWPPSSKPPRHRPPLVSTGSFFWATHTFDDASAASSFWSWAREHDLSSPHPGLLHHHCFLPTGVAEADPVFSVWESREPLGVEEFQRFLDGPNSLVAGLCTSQAMELTNLALPPSAAFPRRQGSFAGSIAMPLMDDSMNSIGSVMGMIRSFQRQVIYDDEEQLPYGEWTKVSTDCRQCDGRSSEEAPASAVDEEPRSDPDDELMRKIESVMPFLRDREEAKPRPGSTGGR
jgi:hypothetical protein